MSRTILLLATLAVACSEPSVRAYSEIVALDDGSALVTWQDKGRSFGVSRVGPSARVEWSADLGGRPQDGRLDHGIIVSDRLVALRTYQRADRAQEVEGLSLENGRRAWVTRLLGPRGKGSADGLGHFSGYATGDAIRPFMKRTGPMQGGELLDIEPLTGRLRTRIEVPIHHESAPLTLAGGLILHDEGRSVAVITGGAVTLLESRGIGCVINDEYWRLVRTPETWELVPLRDQRRNSILVEPTVPDHVDRELTLVGCGSYRDWFVLFLKTRQGSEQTIEVRIVDRDGKVVRRVLLGRGHERILDPDLLHMGAPRASFATGALTRFVPLTLGKNHAELRLVMVDLEEGAIRWQTPRRSMDIVFRAGDRWYWSWPADGVVRDPYLAMLDGETGVIAKAIQIKARDVQRLGPRNVAGDSIWVLANLLTTSRTVPQVVRLDAGTLRVQATTPEFVVAEVAPPAVEIVSAARNP